MYIISHLCFITLMMTYSSLPKQLTSVFCIETVSKWVEFLVLVLETYLRCRMNSQVTPPPLGNMAVISGLGDATQTMKMPGYATARYLVVACSDLVAPSCSRVCFVASTAILPYFSDLCFGTCKFDTYDHRLRYFFLVAVHLDQE
jgi:hypothetical protein